MDLDRLRLDFWTVIEEKFSAFCKNRRKKIYLRRLNESREVWLKREVEKGG